jgi:two-component system, OmpR family, phosphate regulon response regulator PhoB
MINASGETANVTQMLPSQHARAIGGAADRTVVRILVVESDASLRASLSTSLTDAGHEVEAAGSGQAGLAVARASHPDIVLFDLLLPDIQGVEFCRLLRSESGKRPSLCVLTSAADEANRVAAFEAGVDDYVVKPHSMRELLLRIRSLSRRRSHSAAAPESIVLGSMKVDREARRVDIAGTAVELTRREFDLLLCLVQRAGRVQTRDSLVASVWGEIADSGRVVDTTVKRLRKKLGPKGPAIRTVRGVGYKLVAE